MGRNFDKEMAKRVWERVQSAQPEVPVQPTNHTDMLRIRPVFSQPFRAFCVGSCYQYMPRREKPTAFTDFPNKSPINRKKRSAERSFL